MQGIPRFVLAALAVAASACSGSDEDLSDVRAEVADLRAEQRAMRQEIREIRESLPKSTATEEQAASTEPPAADDDEAPAEPPPAAAAAAAAPAYPKAPKAAPAAPARSTGPGKPSAQGSVNIQVESNPAGAAVYLADKKVGETPVIIKTQVGSSEINVRLEKKGYRPRLMTLRPEEDTKISVQLAKKSE